jgi:phage baseplate assembly protein W
MSFDLKLSGGDLIISNNGDFSKVENSEKLVQDALKILATPLGSNPFFPGYGSPLTSSSIGAAQSPSFASDVLTQNIRASMELMMQLQKDQLRVNQTVTAEEQLAAIGNIFVQQDAVDPRMYIAKLTLISKAFMRVNLPDMNIQP